MKEFKNPPTKVMALAIFKCVRRINQVIYNFIDIRKLTMEWFIEYLATYLHISEGFI